MSRICAQDPCSHDAYRQLPRPLSAECEKIIVPSYRAKDARESSEEESCITVQTKWIDSKQYRQWCWERLS